jgi:hypothetical protein
MSSKRAGKVIRIEKSVELISFDANVIASACGERAMTEETTHHVSVAHHSKW